jgi:hypothetical protein
MNEFKDNHFVPRLVLRRFSNKITIYNVKTGILEEDRKCEDVFVERELYPHELEKKFNKHIEGRFGDLLNNKILKADKVCELTRKELMIVKKFLLIAQLRVITPDRFIEFEKFFINYYKEVHKDLPFKEKVMENETFNDRWFRNLRVVLESDNLEEIIKHPDVTIEVFRWASIYYSGYLAIWDNTESKEDYIITDIGMTSEQDLLLYATGINQKLMYLYNEIQNEKNKSNIDFYFNLSELLINFHENFLMFSISKNRMLVLISPFFRLYDNIDTPNLPVPNIWTSKISNKKLFEKNKVKYTKIVNNTVIKNDKDIFIYKIHHVNKKDAIYMNLLMLDRIENTVGFADLTKVRRSIFNYYKAKDQKVSYDKLVKKMKEKELL